MQFFRITDCLRPLPCEVFPTPSILSEWIQRFPVIGSVAAREPGGGGSLQYRNEASRDGLILVCKSSVTAGQRLHSARADRPAGHRDIVEAPTISSDVCKRPRCLPKTASCPFSPSNGRMPHIRNRTGGFRGASGAIYRICRIGKYLGCVSLGYDDTWILLIYRSLLSGLWPQSRCLGVTMFWLGVIVGALIVFVLWIIQSGAHDGSGNP
jgi:hypothetical protein